MKLRKIFILGLVFFCLLGTAVSDIRSEIRIESVAWNPLFIEAGDDVTIYGKFVNRPIERSWAVQNPDNVPQLQNSNIFYKAMLEPADDLAKEYIIIKESKKNVGHLFIGESWTTPFEIKVRENAVATSYKMKFSVIETDVDNTFEETTKVYEFDLPIKGVVKFNVDSQNTVKLGSTSDITINVKNEGLGDARHVAVALDLTAPFTPVRTSELYVGDLAGKESKNVTFEVSLGSETDAMVYKIPLTITYIDDNGTQQEIKRDIGVGIDAKPDMKVGIENSDTFTAGTAGTVSIEVVNEGFVDAKFVRLSLEPTGDYVVTSIKEFYIGNLDSDDIETEEFGIEIDGSVDKAAIPLKVRLQYKGEGSDQEYTNECDVDLKILSQQEYAEKTGGGNGTSTVITLLLALPVLFFGMLGIWFIYKVFRLVMDYINSKLFSK